jgi:hypothetical protein
MVKSLFIQEKINNEYYYFMPSVSITNKEIQNAYLLPIMMNTSWATKTEVQF